MLLQAKTKGRRVLAAVLVIKTSPQTEGTGEKRIKTCTREKRTKIKEKLNSEEEKRRRFAFQR